MQITINQLDTYVMDQGIADALPVVFIHGFPISSRMWDAQVQALKSTCRVVTYDVRGHGSTEPGDGIYTIEFFVDDLFALLDHLNISTAVLCGLSMGGYIALRAIERDAARIAGLVLCDTRSEADTNEAKIKRSEAIRAARHNQAAFAHAFTIGALSDTTRRNSREKLELFESIINNNPIQGICGTLLALASRTDTTPVLSRIRVPTLVMVGSDDTITPLAAAESLQKQIPGARLQIIPNAGHFSVLENSEVANSHLRSFLDSIPKAANGRNAHAM